MGEWTRTFPQLAQVRLNEPCGRMFCRPRWKRSRANSLNLSDWELWLVWQGRGWMRTRTRTLPLSAGFCTLMRPGGIYDAGQEADNPLGITFIHFDLLRAAARKNGRATQRKIEAGSSAADSSTADSSAVEAGLSCWPQWPEFFLLEDVTYADELTRRIIAQMADNRAASEALLHAFLLDLLERPELDEHAAAMPPAATGGAAAGGAPAAVSASVSASAGVDVLAGAVASAGAVTSAGAVGGVAAPARPLRPRPRAAKSGQTTHGLPHYREFLQLIARVRTLSPEALPTVAQMAASMSLSAEHFSRLFRQFSGQSPMRFIIDLRLTHARHLLLESSLSVGEIAELLRYSDVYFFSRQFKEKIGVSPLAYRQSAGGS